MVSLFGGHRLLCSSALAIRVGCAPLDEGKACVRAPHAGAIMGALFERSVVVLYGAILVVLMGCICCCDI